MQTKAIAIALAAQLTFLSATFSTTADAYAPPVSALKIGLFYGGSAVASGNLQNVAGFGGGYEFGYFDGNCNFVGFGAVTGETTISVVRDRNMAFNSAENRYEPGTGGGVVVGCFHIQHSGTFGSYYSAKTAADQFADSFVKYSGGAFYVMTGNYTTYNGALAAMGARGISGASVDSGTAYTVAAVITGTDTILFEFDNSTASYLGVMPISPGGETKCATWCSGYRYYGGFQYGRPTGGDITVINIVDIEDYTRGVLPYEMSNAWPKEALKAQALCARSYAVTRLNSHRSGGFDLCTTEHCQVYHGLNKANELTDACVDETRGQYITYNGEACEAYFSSSDGGAIENVENYWVEAIPYLRGVMDPYEEDIASIADNYKWSVAYTPAQLAARLKSRGYNCGSSIASLQITRFTDTGNVYQVTVKDNNGKTFTITKGEAIRAAFGVNSIRFTVGGQSAPTQKSIYVDDPWSVLDGGISGSYAIDGDGAVSAIAPGKSYAVTGTGAIEEISGETRRRRRAPPATA